VVLPNLRPTPPPEKPAEPAKAGTPWNVIVDQAYSGNGHFRVRDYIVEPVERRDIGIGGVRLTHFELLASPNGRPGKGLVEAKFGDGRARRDRRAVAADGFAVSAKVSIKPPPLDRLRSMRTRLGDFAAASTRTLRCASDPKNNPRITGAAAPASFWHIRRVGA
jgi:hypothetical protein